MVVLSRKQSMGLREGKKGGEDVKSRIRITGINNQWASGKAKREERI
jgi:hypothetical protein